MSAEFARSASTGVWLRESRQAAGLTQEQLAERSGLAVRTISDLERGVSRPYPRSIRMLVKALELPQTLADELIVQYRSGSAWTIEPTTVPRQLPTAPRQFVGRRSELESLDGLRDQIGGPGGVVVGAITGMAGVGKTALALHWAHRVAEDFPDGQLYADLAGFGPSGAPVEPAMALRGFLDGLGVPAVRVPRDLQARAAMYRSLVAERRLLVVLDNARDMEQLRPLLPGSPASLVLVTSRARLADLAVLANAELLALGVLSDEEARQLLTVRLGGDRIAGEPEIATELIELCARLPLALAIAAARAVAYPDLPLSRLTGELRDAANRLDALDAGNAATSMRAVLSWSYQQLPELPARMFRSLAVHPGPGITTAVAASTVGIPLGQARHTLRALAAANLISEYVPYRYALHDLLRAFAAEQAQTGLGEDHRAATCRMLDHYLYSASAADVMISWMNLWDDDPATLPPPRPDISPESFVDRDQALAWFDAEHVVLLRVTSLAAQTGFYRHAWQIARFLIMFFRLRGHWNDMVATLRIALTATKRLGDQDAQAHVRCGLGVALAQGGNFRQAHAHLERSLELFQALGNQSGVGSARIIVGIVLSWQGRDRDALAVTEAVLPPPPSSAGEIPTEKAISRERQATVLANLGWFHARLGEFDKARACCQQALELYTEIGNRYGQGITLDSLAFIYQQNGDYAKGIAHYRHAADQFRHVGALYELGDALGRLGDTCQAAADIDGARAAWQQAIQILEGIQHPDAKETLAKLRQIEANTHVQLYHIPSYGCSSGLSRSFR